MHSFRNRLVFMFAAFALMNAGLWLSILLWYPQGLSSDTTVLYFRIFNGVHVLWLVVLFAYGLMDFGGTIRKLSDLASRLVVVYFSMVLVGIVYFYVQPGLVLTPRRFLLVDSAITVSLVGIFYGLVLLLNRKYLYEQVYIMTDPANVSQYVTDLNGYEMSGFRLAGAVSPAELPEFRPKKQAILLFPDAIKNSSIAQDLFSVRMRNIKMMSYSSFYETITKKIHLESLDHAWFLEKIAYRSTAMYGVVKRMMDLLVGIIGTVVLLAVYLPLAAAIRLTSAGPVFYRQARTGQYGTIIVVYKFRTMRVTDNPANTWTKNDDSRITSIGRLLRRTRLDELPQVFNLLTGTMSLVGPRPEQPHIVEQLRKQIPFYDERHVAKPGITGWGQLNVYARTVEQSKLKLQYDLYYIKHRSLLFDIEIILKTFYHVFTSSDT